MQKQNKDAGFKAQQRREVQAEINANKISIDKSVFQKTDKERVELKNAKREHKRMIA